MGKFIFVVCIIAFMEWRYAMTAAPATPSTDGDTTCSWEEGLFVSSRIKIGSQYQSSYHDCFVDCKKKKNGGAVTMAVTSQMCTCYSALGLGPVATSSDTFRCIFKKSNCTWIHGKWIDNNIVAEKSAVSKDHCINICESKGDKLGAMWIANLKYCTCHDRANYVKRKTTSAQVYETCDLSIIKKNHTKVGSNDNCTLLETDCGSGYKVRWNRTNTAVATLAIESCYAFCDTSDLLSAVVTDYQPHYLQPIDLLKNGTRLVLAGENGNWSSKIENTTNGFFVQSNLSFRIKFNKDVFINKLSYKYSLLESNTFEVGTVQKLYLKSKTPLTLKKDEESYYKKVEIYDLDLFYPGIWGPWSEWEWFKDKGNGYFNRSRDCYKNITLELPISDKLDRRYCVGMFTQYNSKACQIKVKDVSSGIITFESPLNRINSKFPTEVFMGRNSRNGELYEINATEPGDIGGFTFIGRTSNSLKINDVIVIQDTSLCLSASWEMNEKWSDCKVINTTHECGAGIQVNRPDKCIVGKNGDCGEKPISVRSCYAVCKDMCVGNEIKNTDVTWEPNSLNDSFIDIWNGDTIILSKMKITIFTTNVVGDPFQTHSLNELIPMKWNGKIGINESLSVLVENGTIMVSRFNIDKLATKLIFSDLTGCEFPTFWKWVDVGVCNTTCGNGTIRRRNMCALGDGREFPDHYCIDEKQEDILEPCWSICFNFSMWSNWTDCVGLCGPLGTQNRTKDCLADGQVWNSTVNCTNFSDETFYQNQTCYIKEYPCYNFTQWSSWSVEDMKCETYNVSRTRICYRDYNESLLVNETKCMERFDEKFGNEEVVVTETSIKCFDWGNWKEYKPCDVICENGTVVMKRTCQNYRREDVHMKNCDRDLVNVTWANRTWCEEQENCVHQYRNFTCVTGQKCVGYTPWSEWKNCTKTCGTGRRTRERKCAYRKEENCKTFNDIFEEELCNKNACPVDGHWLQWSLWTVCSKSCGPGKSGRQRICQLPQHGGNNCSYEAEGSRVYKDCKLKECSGVKIGNKGENCVDLCKKFNLSCNSDMTKYSQNGSAMFDVKCDSGNQNYKNDYDPSYANKNGRYICQGYVGISKTVCAGKPPLDTRRLCYCVDPGSLLYGDWVNWGACNVACGDGIRTRFRADTRDPAKIVTTSTSEYTDTQSCGDPCPVNGNWGSWTDTDCSANCEFGTRERMRYCNSPAPSNGGKFCSGQNYTEESCYVPKICPVNGGWADWSDWGLCDKPCNGGHQKRTRSCTNPKPKFGGSYCLPESRDGTEVNGFDKKVCNMDKPCLKAEVKVHLEFTDERYDESMADLQSDVAKRFEERLTRQIKAMYKDHPQFKGEYNGVKVELHGLQRGKKQKLVKDDQFR